MNDGDIQFEKGKAYQNRLGQHTVLKISGDEMRVRYDIDGHEQTLDIEIQSRIFKNMLRED